MAIYAVGDVQGCFTTFLKLLDLIKFDGQNDKLILLGDVINRGANSLEMLRFVKKNPDCMEMILGNHDLFAIALALGAIKDTRPHTLGPLLLADDRDELIAWLRCQPLLKRSGSKLFVHAGILPCFSIPQALDYAHALSQILMGDSAKKFLAGFYEKTPFAWQEDLSPKKQLRLALASFTLLRMCSSKTVMDNSYNGSLKKGPKGLKPWFMLRDDGDFSIYFGHWAALGSYQHQNYYCLDSACVWGQELSSLRLSDHKLFQVASAEN